MIKYKIKKGGMRTKLNKITLVIDTIEIHNDIQKHLKETGKIPDCVNIIIPGDSYIFGIPVNFSGE